MALALDAQAPLAMMGTEQNMALSPDGTRLVYMSGDSPRRNQRLYVLDLNQPKARALEGVGNPHAPFMSPDGKWIGLFDGGTLKKVAVAGGAATTVCEFPLEAFGSERGGGSPLSNVNSRGASWGTDGTIVFATANSDTGLFRVAADGGDATVLTTPDSDNGELDHQWPEILPGGQAVLFTIISTASGIANAQIAVLDLRTHEKKILIKGGSQPHYVPTGHIVYATAGRLLAVAFDPARLTLLGDPVPVVPGVATNPFGSASFAVAQDGTLVYLAGGVQTPAFRTVVWVDRQGNEESLGTPPRFYLYPRLSPDGTRVALDVRDQDNDIWVWDLGRRALNRLTFDQAQDRYPVWSPDGRRLVFSRTGPAGGVFWQAADGTGAAQRLSERQDLLPTSFTPDGAGLLVRGTADDGKSNVMMLALEGAHGSQRPGRSDSPREGGGLTSLTRTAFDEANGEISPDGRWLAYESVESGRSEIYVRPFPDVDRGRWQVTTGGGIQPLWARSGRELFFRALPSGAVMVVPVEARSTFTVGSPVQLFEGAYYLPVGNPGRTFDVSADGRRFLMIKQAPPQATEQVVLVQNWLEELTRLVPTP